MHAIKVSFVKMFACNFPILCIVFLAGFVRVDAQRSCITPYNADGQCVDANRCGYLTEQLEAFGLNGPPPQFINFIRNSRCTSEANDQVLICCEDQFIQPKIRKTLPLPPPPSSLSPITPPRDNVPDLGNEQVNESGLNILKAVDCGELRNNRVSFGNDTKLNEFPFMALLKYDEEKPFQCGGALITNLFVISAPHCWVGRKNPPIAVRLGEHNYNTDQDCEIRGNENFCNPPVEDYGIAELITHPLYKQNEIHHDIGLIRLDRVVTFQVHIKPICLPIYEITRVLAKDQEYIIAGWGNTEISTRTNQPSSVLLKAKVNHHSREYCQDIFKLYTITDQHICAGGDNSINSCFGDSGGPLFYPAVYNGRIPKWVQFGIVSNGVAGCGTSSFPTVYTKIASYLPWVTNVIAINEFR